MAEPIPFRQPARDERPLPQNIEVEQALLGAVLLNNDAFYRVADFLKPEHFSEPLHAKLFEVCSALIRANKVANPITLKTFIPADLDVAGVPIMVYVARLAAEATTVLNAEDYGRIVHDLSVRRELIQLADDVRAAATDADLDYSPTQQVEEIERRLFELTDASRRNPADQAVTVDEAIAGAVNTIAQAYQNDGRLIGVTWGSPSVDNLTHGLHRGEVTVLAGRPSMGKSALALSAARAAAQAGHGVVVFSLEMSPESLGLRLLSEATAADGAPVPYFRMRSGQINERDFDRIVDRARALQGVPIIIEPKPSITVAHLGARIRRNAQRFKRNGHTLGLVVVDYMQLVKPGDRYRGERVHEVSEVSSGLKRIAREEDVPLLAVSQLSREVERREDKRPMLADLRDSGSIEQDADSVVFLYREEYYLRGREPKAETEPYVKWEAELAAAAGRLDVIVAKQRHGPTGAVTVAFDAATNMVRELERSEDETLPLGPL